jgi:ABC-2 type transport system ATP-binding protein
MIEARDLHKRYGSAVAVEGLTFDITPGLVTGFLGPNGAGKSTTLRMILGLDRPTQGTVTVAGRAYRDLPAPMHEVGALLDAKAVHGKRTARQHLRWLAQAGGLPRDRVAQVLAEVGLSEVADRRIGGFSLGMAQRLGIAAALLGDPRTLLFDEPVNGLDPEGIRWIRTLMRRLAGEGRTVVVSSHLMHEMEETADHVLVIGRGRLIADTSMAEFRRRSASSHVHVVSPDAARLHELLERAGGAVIAVTGDSAANTPALTVSGLEAARIGDLAAEHGLRVHELTPRSASLETAFMELTHDSVDYRPAGVA